MIKVNQKHLHSEENGVKGDCWRACIASIIECDIEQLPDPNNTRDWTLYEYQVKDTLKKMGYKLEYKHVAYFKGEIGNFAIAIGTSPRGNFNHAVVWETGIVHDPHPDESGIENIQFFEVITKI